MELARRGKLDNLSFECLAERTIALAQLARLANPAAGYDPNLDARTRAVLGPCRASGTRILTNAGAGSPVGSAERILAIARDLGLPGLHVGVVTGDELTGHLDLASSLLAEIGQPL